MIMVTAAEAAQEYRMTLAELQNNNKTQINLLTILAEDYVSFAPAIVDTIEKQIYTVPRDQKLPILYVTDSILKNVTKSPYKELFARIIVKIFMHIFINVDEKTRSSMYKVRQTWTGIFNAGLLYRLDMKVNAEDKAWPLTAPAGQAAPTAPPAGAAVPQRIHVNPRFIQQPNSGVGLAKPTSSSSRTVVVDTDTRTVRVELKKEPGAAVVPKKTKRGGDVLDTILGAPAARPIKTEPEEAASPSHNKSPQTVVPGKRRAAEPPVDPDSKKKRSPIVPVHGDRKPYINKHPAQQGSNFVTAGTAQPGSHAFSVPVVAATHNAAPHPPAPAITMAPMLPQVNNNYLPPPIYPPVPVVSAASQAYSSPNVHTAPPPLHVAPPPHFAGPPPGYGGMPPVAPYGAGYPPALPPQPTVPVEITHEAVRLEGIPANNRIFVDSKAHEVLYIEDSAVIERNGLPHRIYFSGPPRNVIIDGTAYMMAFGERKTVYIDGQPHVLRFGAPSRELYMGDFAFKGQFGGPPIMATINGMRHEIRLSGPAPEVKIEPDPAYDLTRFMPQVREGKAPEPKQESQNPFDILRRLHQSGYLKQKNVPDTVVRDEKPAFSMSNNRKPTVKSASPPIASEHTFDTVMRRSAPSASLRDFNMTFLKVRYDAIVDALHEKQHNACPHCGLRMELKGEKYERHLDWHVKRNLQTLERTSTSRPWYASGKDWLKNEDDGTASSSNGNAKGDNDLSTLPSLGSSETSHRKCFVCQEEFVEKFDEEDDMWKLRNCVLVHGQTYHSACVADASMSELRPTDHDVEDVKPLSLKDFHLDH